MKFKTKANSEGQMMSTDFAAVEREGKHQKWMPVLRFLTKAKLPWLLIILGLALQLCSGQLYVIFPSYLSQIFSGDFSLEVGVGTVTVTLLKGLCSTLIISVSSYAAERTKLSFQKAAWRKVSRLPMSYFQEHEPRSLVTRVTGDITNLATFICSTIGYMLSSAYQVVGSLAVLFTYDWRLAVSQIAMLALVLVVYVWSGRLYFRMSNRAQCRMSDLGRYLSAITPNLSLVKLFGQEKREEKNGMDWIFNSYKTEMDNALIERGVAFAESVVGLVRTLVVIFMGVWLMGEGAIDFGIFIAFYYYGSSLTGSFEVVLIYWRSLKSIQGAAAHFLTVMDQPEEANPGAKDAKDAAGAIAFQNVTFGYEDTNVLEDVSFTAEPGQFTAIVGSSGAGKSTILNLIERYYAPKSGCISLAGEKADSYELHSWRGALGLISQNSPLFSGTVRENITYGVDGEVTQQQLEDAARAADALDFIRELPDGFDTQVGESGCKLSGGQRQRIAIARALILNAKVLVLDEATANLDAESEHNVNETIGKLAKDHTILMVAHHIDAVKDADKIVVLEKGRVAAQGKHSDLMTGCALYRRMVELQAAGAAV